MLKFKYGRYVSSTAPNATPDLSWTTTILAPGAQGDKWTAELMGLKVEVIVPAAATPTIVADLIAAALDALPGITSTNVNNVITTTRTVAPTSELDVVSHLTLKVEGYGPDADGIDWNGGPFPQPSGRDGVQYMDLDNPTGPTGGTYTLTVYSNFDDDGNPSGGQTTTAIPWNASAATIQAALDALSNVEPGDVVVADNLGGGEWTYSFTWSAQYRLDVSQIPLIGLDGALLTGMSQAGAIRPSAGSFTNVVASEAAVSFGEFAVYASVPQA